MGFDPGSRHPAVKSSLFKSKGGVKFSSLVMASTLFTLSLFASSALARLVQYDFNVVNGQVAPDGVTRNAVLGMFVPRLSTISDPFK